MPVLVPAPPSSHDELFFVTTKPVHKLLHFPPVMGVYERWRFGCRSGASLSFFLCTFNGQVQGLVRETYIGFGAVLGI